jgi:hypothetical protein
MRVALWSLTPKCPVEDRTREWIDRRMGWLGEQFGMPVWRMGRAIEPTDEFFPDPYDRTPEAVQRMMARVCTYMGVDAARVTLRFYREQGGIRMRVPHETRSSGSAGLYMGGEKETIAVETSNLEDPMAVVATLAHELAHVRLLGEHRMTREEEDMEPLTDLATVFFGLGIFAANSRFRFTQWSREGWSGWKASRLGYLDEPMFGYALGLWAVGRGEQNPKWAKQLAVNPRTYMKQTIRYLGQYPPTGLKI